MQKSSNSNSDRTGAEEQQKQQQRKANNGAIGGQLQREEAADSEATSTPNRLKLSGKGSHPPGCTYMLRGGVENRLVLDVPMNASLCLPGTEDAP